VSLGSRQNLCINEDVKSLKNINRINDRCLELQKNDKDNKKAKGENAPKKKKLTKGCPFYAYQQMQKFRDHVLVDIKDIEQLVSVGEKLNACPYYGTRLAIPPAQVRHFSLKFILPLQKFFGRHKTSFWYMLFS